MPRRNPRLVYQLKRRDRIEASPSMGEKFPTLKGLKVVLQYFDAEGKTKNGEMKCKLNVEHARSMLWYACPGVECLEGDFDLTDALAQAVAAGSKVAAGERRCPGTRKRGDRSPEPCQTLLRYTLNLTYD